MLELVTFADTDYARKATDRRLISGGAVTCTDACVCWGFRITRGQDSWRKNAVFASYLEHIDVRHHVLKELIFRE